MAQGTLWWFNEATGYGLVRPEDGGRDLLVRGADVASGRWLEALEEGVEVSYEANGRNGTRAITVSGGRRYSWRDDCLERHEGKEARHEYYAQLEEGEEV